MEEVPRLKNEYIVNKLNFLSELLIYFVKCFTLNLVTIHHERSIFKLNIRKISEITGYSPATVSNALNNKGRVRKETAKRIIEVAEELGYKHAKKIKKVRFVVFRRNGLVIDNSQFHPAVIEGVERQAKALGYETVYNNIDISDAGYSKAVKEILEDKESAVVLLGTEMINEDFAPFINHDERLVLLDGWCDKYFFDSVLISNTDSTYSAVEYLIGKGHREIGYIRGDFRIQAFNYREIGFLRAMNRNGIQVNKDYWATVGTKNDTAYEDMKKYLEQHKKLPTAFFADNDIIAVGAMRALKDAGYKVPDDVSVMGFDDVSFSAVSDPPLTTVRVYKQDLGETAVRELYARLERGQICSCKIQVYTSLVERESVKALC